MLLQRGVPRRVYNTGCVQLRRSGHQSCPRPDPVFQDPHPAGWNSNLGKMLPKNWQKCHPSGKVIDGFSD